MLRTWLWPIRAFQETQTNERHMKNLHHLFLSLLALVATASMHAKKTPNVVVIFIDDMGYADIGPFGAKAYTKFIGGCSCDR